MADTSNLSQFLTDVAGAIKEKTGKTDKIPAANFDQEILSIETGIDTSDATAGPSDIISPKTAYVKGQKITGTIKANYISSDFTRTKVIQQENVFDFNNVLAVCGVPKTQTISIYKVENELLTNKYEIILSSLGIPEKYTLFSASISKVPVERNVYNIGLYVCDTSSTRAADQMLYVVRFDVDKHSIISSDDTLTRMLSSSVSLDTAGNYVNRYGVIQSHPTNPNWFICGVGCNNTNGSYGRLHTRIIKFVNDQPITLQVSLLAGYDGWNTTFAFIDLMPTEGGAYTWIFIKGVKNGSSQYVGLFKYEESTNKLVTTSFNEKTYGAGILNKEYYIYNNNKVVSFRTGSTVATFPITLNWQKFIKYTGGNKFLLFDISTATVKLYTYEASNNTVELLQTYTYGNGWDVMTNSSFMSVHADDFTAMYYDVPRQLISVLSSSNSVIKSVEIKDKIYIDTSDANVIASDMLSGKKAYSTNGLITGTMPNNGALNYTPSLEEQSIPQGYTSGGTVSAAVMTNDDYQTCMDLAKYILYGRESPILYTELEYIQGTGTQWIDTGITMAGNSKIELKYKSSTTSTNAICGTAWSAAGIFLMTYGGRYRYHYNNASNDVQSASTSAAKVFVMASNTISIDEVSYTVGSIKSGSFGKHLGLFLPMTRGGNSGEGPGSGNLYYCKLYENDILVGDFIPVKRKEDDVICLYDKVSKQFLLNQGTGSFIAGPERS